MQPKQFRNLTESARSIIHPIVENGDHDCKGKDCPEHDHENEDTGHQEIKHKGKTCKEAHPGMEHEEWEMSQNESVELDETRDRGELIDLMKKTGARVASDTLTDKGRVTPKTNQAKRIYNKTRKRLGLDEAKPKINKPHGIKNDPAYKKAKTKKQIKQARDQWNLKNPMDLWVGEEVELDEYSATSDAGHKDAKWSMQVKQSRKAGIFNKPRSEYLKLAKKKLAKTKETTESKKHTVKTQSGTKETVSRDDLKAAGDLYDRLKKREDVDYGLQDSTKETLGRFIENSLSDGNDIQEMKTDRLATRKTRMYQGGERGSEIK